MPDNTAAMEAALASLSQLGGGVVEIGAGTYHFASDTLNRRAIGLPSGITIRGAGRDNTILAITGGTVCNFFVARNQSNVAFEDLSIIGNNVSPSDGSVYGPGSAIQWVLGGDATSSVSAFAIRRVHLENFRGPYWVDIRNSAPRERSLDMHALMIDDLTFTSRPGNSPNPSSLGINSAAVCINGLQGAIRNVAVSALAGDARHIKTGIILYHQVIGAKLDGISVKAAGQSGAADDGGGYAVQLYDTYYRMESVEVSNALIDSPRSVGIYVAGGTDISIVNPKIWGQTDQHAGTLPKGAIVFNGTRRWRLNGGQLHNNWRDLDIAMPQSGDEANPDPVNGLVSHVNAAGSNNGIMIRHAAGHVATGISIRDCQWQTSTRTVVVKNGPAPLGHGHGDAGGYVQDIHFENCQFRAGPGYRALDLYGTSGSPAGGYSISNCVLVGSNPLFAMQQTGTLKICGCLVRDLGTSAGSAAAALINCPNLQLSNTTFESPGRGGIGINLSGSEGSITALKFHNCSRNLAATGPHAQLGRDMPAFAGHKGQYVQNLDSAHGEYQGWICLGGTKWSGTNN